MDITLKMQKETNLKIEEDLPFLWKRGQYSFLEPNSEVANIDLNFKNSVQITGLLKIGNWYVIKPIKVGNKTFLLKKHVI